jgi:hypothetical protein
MSNVTPLSRKQAARAELEQLTAEFEQQGRQINRSPGKTVGIRCDCCGLGRVVSVYIANKATCVRCHSQSVTVHW